MGRIVGIDLGMTNSVIATFDDCQTEPQAVRNLHGQYQTPSVVGSSMREQILVGDRALFYWPAEPMDTIVCNKRLMGLGVTDEEVEKVRSRFLYQVVEPSDGTKDTVRVVMRGKEYSPIDISAIILRQLKEDAERHLGDRVTHAVITVPAYFSKIQRDATRKAAFKAGLKVAKILDEPTAAVISLGIEDEDGPPKNFLVFDLGGGTLDISVISWFDQTFVPLTFRGDMWLGGDNFDQVLIDYVVEHVRQHFGFDPRSNLRFMVELKQAAQKAKESLSAVRSVELMVAGLLQDSDGGSIDVELEVTREAYERMISSLVERALALTNKALADVSLAPEQIDYVLMAGSSSRIPMVQQAMADLFGTRKVTRRVDPKYCVSFGAAILAERIGIEHIACRAPSPDNPKTECGHLNRLDATVCAKCGVSLDAAQLEDGMELNLGTVSGEADGEAMQATQEGRVEAFASPEEKGGLGERNRTFGDARDGKFDGATPKQDETKSNITQRASPSDKERALRSRLENLIGYSEFVLDEYSWAIDPNQVFHLRNLIDDSKSALEKGNAGALEEKARLLDDARNQTPEVVRTFLGLRGAIVGRIQPVDLVLAMSLMEDLDGVEGACKSGNRADAITLRSLVDKVANAMIEIDAKQAGDAHCPNGHTVPPDVRNCPTCGAEMSILEGDEHRRNQAFEDMRDGKFDGALKQTRRWAYMADKVDADDKIDTLPLQSQVENLIGFCEFVLHKYSWAIDPNRTYRLNSLVANAKSALETGNMGALEEKVHLLDDATNQIPEVVRIFLGLRGAIVGRIHPADPVLAMSLMKDLDDAESAFKSSNPAAEAIIRILLDNVNKAMKEIDSKHMGMHCPNGHAVGYGNRYCPTCGEDTWLCRSTNEVNDAVPEVPGSIVDPVHFAITGPRVVCSGINAVLCVWAYLESQRKELEIRASEELGGRRPRIQSVGPAPVARGTILSVRMHIDELMPTPMNATIMWEGEIGNASFPLAVPKEIMRGVRTGSIEVRANEFRIAILYFTIEVGSKASGKGQLEIQERRHRTAFASYASADRDAVLARIQGIQKAAPQLDIFVDVLKLRSGQYWGEELRKEIPARDVFYLFWSQNAMTSKWVEKEWRCALETRGLDFIDPVPLQPPDKAPPPPELATKHFNDWVLAFMKQDSNERSSQN